MFELLRVLKFRVFLMIVLIVEIVKCEFFWDIGKVFIMEMILLRIEDYLDGVVFGEDVIKMLILVVSVRFVGVRIKN